MANFTDSVMQNVIIQKAKPVLAFVRDFYTANIAISLLEYFANSNLSTDAIIGLLMTLIFIFSKVLFYGT